MGATSYEIGLDFDGVFADCASLKAEYTLEKGFWELPPALSQRRLAILTRIMSTRQYLKMQQHIYHRPTWVDRMQPVDGALAGVDELIEAGHHPHIFTDRREQALTLTTQWLLQQSFPPLMVSGGKLGAARAAKLDIFLDDDIGTLNELEGAVRHRFLLTQPYNLVDGVLSNRAEDGAVERVWHWTDFCRRVGELTISSY